MHFFFGEYCMVLILYFEIIFNFSIDKNWFHVEIMRNAISTCAHCGIVRVHIALFFQCLIKKSLLLKFGSE
jgi:hypothetical protein